MEVAIDGERTRERQHVEARPAPEGRRSVGSAVVPQLPAGNLAISRLLGAEAGAGPPGEGITPGLAGAIGAERGKGSSLPGALRADLEAGFGGADFSAVRVHTGDSAAALNREVRAEAFTTGNDIFFAGEVDAASRSGRELLAHELTHVVQQQSGAASGISRPADPGEVQARRVGRAVAAGMTAEVAEALGARAGNAALTRRVSRLAVQRSPAEDLIDDNTSWLNLDEGRLGRTLLGKAAAGDHALVQAVLDELGTTNRDDVALEFTRAAGPEQLAAIAEAQTGRRLLDRLYDELTSGNLGGDEQAQADRILAVKGRRIDPAQAQQQMLAGKVFPFRQGGITVLDDAPIMAERREGGQIWVKQPTRVLGTSMFRAETATLPHDVFIGGALIPEDEIVGVKLYDLGGPTVYRPALFLIQIANQNTTATLTKIAEIAGIGLTLGTGALVGLGVEATLTARVLLWADRAAFVLGTVAMIINEHRGEIIERYGDAGRQFLRYVDIVHSATAIYGFARVTIAMAQLLNGFRTSYQNWRATVRAVENELDDGERAVAQQVSRQADEVLQDADNINASRTKQETPADPVATPEPQQTPQPAPQPRPMTAAEKMAARKAAAEEANRVSQIQQGIERVDRELAAGTHKVRLSPGEVEWLNASPRHKQLAYDPAIKSYRVAEARQALAAEESGVLPGPVVRSIKDGEDMIDGAGVSWSFKAGTGEATVDSTVTKIVDEARRGQNCFSDLRTMSATDQATVRALVLQRLGQGSHAEVRFLPLSVDRIPPR